MGFRSRLAFLYYSSVSLNRQRISSGITRLDIKELLKLNNGEKVRAQGWVSAIRRHKTVTFLQIHDGIANEEIQLVSTPGQSEKLPRNTALICLVSP